MSIEGRKSIHKNIKTSLDSDESLLASSDSEITNSPKLSRREFERRSPSPFGNEQKATTRTKSPIRKELPSYSRHATTRAKPVLREESSEIIVSSKKNANKSGSSSYLWICTILAVIMIISSMCLRAGISEKATVMDSNVKRCTYSNLRVKYKTEDNYLWNHLTSGIENILNDRSDKPAVYLLVHSGGKTTNELIRDIAQTSSTCFDSSMKTVEIESLDFTSEEALSDYGYVIEKYKQKIKEGNVILIANLNEIPAEAARALHAICDTYSPIVPKVIIYLSLVAENKGERVVETAQEALRQLWEPTIGGNELDPLIARVTDEVILLQSK